MLTVSVRKVLTNKKHSFWEVKAPLLHCNNYAFTRQKLCFHFVITMLLQKTTTGRLLQKTFVQFFCLRLMGTEAPQTGFRKSLVS